MARQDEGSQPGGLRFCGPPHSLEEPKSQIEWICDSFSNHSPPGWYPGGLRFPGPVRQPTIGTQAEGTCESILRYQNEEPRPSEPRFFHVGLVSCRSEVPIFGAPPALIIVHRARGP